MKHEYQLLNRAMCWVLRLVLIFGFTACTTTPTAPSSLVDMRPSAMSVPYRISDAGHLIVDVSVNGQSGQAFIIDSGATVSAIYKNHTDSLGVVATDRSVSVNGLVATGLRAVAERVELQIDAKIFQPDQLVVLDVPVIDNQAIGLLGMDVLADYAVVFDKDAMTATFILSDSVKPSMFSGWRRIALRNRVRPYPDNGLYYATIRLKAGDAPVLVDTGSNLNIINWNLATLDESVKRVYRKLRSQMKLQGAIDSFPLRMETVFHDVVLGNQTWPNVAVVVMEFDTLSTILPVKDPIMIAGAPMFTPSTFAFDFGGNAIYIYEP